MRKSVTISLIILTSVTLTALLVYIYKMEIKRLLQNPVADPILLIALIIVDCLGGILVPFFIYKMEREEERRKEADIKPILSIEYDDRNSDIFTPSLQLIHPNGNLTGITQKYLRVRVRNKGGVAKHCKAELQVIKWPPSSIHPSLDAKQLVWNGTLEKDISAKGGTELLHVIFSDSRLEQSGQIYAFISTTYSLYPQAPFFRAQDGFGVGSFEVKITVRTEDGSSAESIFRINVTTSYMALSMEKLS